MSASLTVTLTWRLAKPDSRSEDHVLELDPDSHYLINAGSVGQPRDNDPRAAYVLYDPGVPAVTYRRVPYDIPAVQRKIIAAGLPEILAKRLEVGL